MGSGADERGPQTRTTRRQWGVTSLALAAALTVQSAQAFPAEIQVVAKVSLGKNPKLVIRVLEPALKATINLKREDGKTFNFSLGNVGPGTVREMTLDGRVGRHKYEGAMSASVDGETISSPLLFETVVARPITIQVDRSNLDLKKRRLEITTNREVSTAQLKIIGISGEPIEETTTEVVTWAPGKPIVLTWKNVDADDLVRLELRVEDEDGFFNAIELTPWSVEIPHEEVLFATASAAIKDSEVPKLEDSLEKVKDALARFSQLKGVQLFIAGHTDTQGGAAYNLNLSRKRAQSIAAWFAKMQLPIPISFEGFGETAPKVKTADEVDEPRNRRVDYILSIEPPTLTRGNWKRLQ